MPSQVSGLADDCRGLGKFGRSRAQSWLIPSQSWPAKVEVWLEIVPHWPSPGSKFRPMTVEFDRSLAEIGPESAEIDPISGGEQKLMRPKLGEGCARFGQGIRPAFREVARSFRVLTNVAQAHFAFVETDAARVLPTFPLSHPVTWDSKRRATRVPDAWPFYGPSDRSPRTVYPRPNRLPDRPDRRWATHRGLGGGIQTCLSPCLHHAFGLWPGVCGRTGGGQPTAGPAVSPALTPRLFLAARSMCDAWKPWRPRARAARRPVGGSGWC